MLFVWTSEGGPLQYIGLGIFLLQVLPQVLPTVPQDANFNQQIALLLGLATGAVSVAIYKLRSTVTVRQQFSQWTERAQARLREWTGRDVPYYALPALLGILLGCSIAFRNSIDVVRWLPYLGQLVTLLSILGFGQRQQQHAPNNPTRQAKLEQMSALVRSMPLEPFLAEEDMATAPIAQLKQMLETRGASQSELDSFVERPDLVQALQKRRQYSDTCCICFETFHKDEPMRILPQCRHELHVECLDKWVYTFATNAAKLQQDPTCPLCKEGLK